VQDLIETACKKEGAGLQELPKGIRRGVIPNIRSDLAWKLVEELGIPSVEIARQLGVWTSAISQVLRRKQVS
jgi:hypothetical protein